MPQVAPGGSAPGMTALHWCVCKSMDIRGTNVLCALCVKVETCSRSAGSLPLASSYFALNLNS